MTATMVPTTTKSKHVDPFGEEMQWRLVKLILSVTLLVIVFMCGVAVWVLIGHYKTSHLFATAAIFSSVVCIVTIMMLAAAAGDWHIALRRYMPALRQLVRDEGWDVVKVTGESMSVLRLDLKSDDPKKYTYVVVELRSNGIHIWTPTPTTEEVA